MTFTFKKAVRENVGMIWIVAGGTGSGKTMSALRLATGLANGEKFCGIDTENGRMLHYADKFDFDHGEIRAPFRPKAFTDAIESAISAKYKVVIVDNASHEHAGDGGLLAWHDEELDRMAGKVPDGPGVRYDWKKRDACNMAAWIQPKAGHKRMVSKLLALPPGVHLILCLRAEEKIEVTKDDRGKTIYVPKKSLVGAEGWHPVCEKTLPFEATLSVLVTAKKPGVPIPIKLQEQHRPLVDLTKPLDEETGRRLGEWASGAKAKPEPVSAAPKPREERTVPAAGLITPTQEESLEKLIVAVKADPVRFWKYVRDNNLGYEGAVTALEKKGSSS